MDCVRPLAFGDGLFVRRVRRFRFVCNVAPWVALVDSVAAPQQIGAVSLYGFHG